MKRFVSLALVFLMTLGVMKVSDIDVSAAQATGITSGKVYKITNVGSGKCINVHNNYDENDTNVYQWTDDGSVEQTFKVVYNSSYNNNQGGYRFYSKSSGNGNHKVLDIVKSSGSVKNGGNVDIYSPTDDIAQYFQITKVATGQYRISPISNTALALTSYGTSNGSSSGKLSTSAGNIFVSTYSSSNKNQLWTFTEVTSAAETAYAKMGFKLPISGGTIITSGYGNRTLNGALSKHAGIDFRGAEGTEIRSANTGTVVEIFDEPDKNTGRGHCVIVESTSDKVYGKTTKIRTIYMHMKEKPPVSKGSTVTKGSDVIGKVGNTGASYGAHLHFGVISDGSDGRSLDYTRTLNPFWFYTNTSFTYSYW